MKHHASLSSSPPGAPPYTENERAEAMALGISFNGRQYCYRDYRYDRLADAVNYARREMSAAGSQPRAAASPEWLAPFVPTAEQAAEMAAAGITFDGRSFVFSDFRYDRLVDALNYAQLLSTR